MVPTDSVAAPALALGAGTSAGVAWLLPVERLRRSSVMCATRAAQRSEGDAALSMPVTLVSELYSSKNESSERNAESERARLRQAEKLLDEVNGSEELRHRGAAGDPVTQSRAGQEQDRKAIPQDNRTKSSIFSLESNAVVVIEE